MTGILGVISRGMDVFIILFGLVCAAAMMMYGVKLSDRKNRLSEALNRKNSKYSLNPELKELEPSADEDAAITPDTIRVYETDFNKSKAVYQIFVQLISVFPLLGILGTVAGLMQGVTGGDINNMLDSLNLALTSTFWGLICAIGLKFLDAVYGSRIITDVEVMLDDFEKKMNIAELFGKR